MSFYLPIVTFSLFQKVYKKKYIINSWKIILSLSVLLAEKTTIKLLSPEVVVNLFSMQYI